MILPTICRVSSAEFCQVLYLMFCPHYFFVLTRIGSPALTVVARDSTCGVSVLSQVE